MGNLRKTRRNVVTGEARNRPGLRLRLLAILAAFSMLAVSGENAQTHAPATKSASASGHSLGSVRVALYAGIGNALTQYDVDVQNAVLIKRGTVTLPGNV